MKALRKYKCKKCSYTIEIAGGTDVGFIAKTKTMLCEHCMSLVDVVTEYWTDEKHDVSVIGICPECKLKNHLKAWNNTKCPCPKCGGRMEVEEYKFLIDWERDCDWDRDLDWDRD